MRSIAAVLVGFIAGLVAGFALAFAHTLAAGDFDTTVPPVVAVAGAATGLVLDRRAVARERRHDDPR